MTFIEKLNSAVEKNNSLLCVGLDPVLEKMPDSIRALPDPVLEFNKQIIEVTKDLVCAYKPQIAYFEALGLDGMRILKDTIDSIPDHIPVILDAKRNDIGSTASAYATAVFDILGADAVTLNPYLGVDSIRPFLVHPGKAAFVLCRTSNPSAGELQDLQSNGQPLYQSVASLIKQWNTIGTCGAVVGATYPEEMEIVRKIMGDDVLFLIPGIGAQGGDVEKTVKAGINSAGTGAIINSARGIIYAGAKAEADTLDEWAGAARDVAVTLRDEINRYR